MLERSPSSKTRETFSVDNTTIGGAQRDRHCTVGTNVSGLPTQIVKVIESELVSLVVFLRCRLLRSRKVEKAEKIVTLADSKKAVRMSLDTVSHTFRVTS